MSDTQETGQSKASAYNLRPPKPKVPKQAVLRLPRRIVVKPRVTKKKSRKRRKLKKNSRVMIPEKPRISENDLVPQPNKSSPEIFCSICLDTENLVQIRRLFCGHAFHSKCINDWLRSKHSCPVCRLPAHDLSALYLSRFREFSYNLTQFLRRKTTNNAH